MSDYSSNGEKGTMKIKNAFLVQNNPYWDIFDALVVDDLHQLGGIYKHLIGLVENMVKKNGKTVIIEKQYQSIPKFRGIKSFDSGFLSTDLVNPTYSELRDHMTQLLAVVHNLIPPQASLCVRAFLDFYIQITSKEHTDDTLAQADEYLNLFFGYLPIFQDVTPSSLNFPKIHMLTEYTNDIRRKGPVDGYSTNHGERLHKSQAKRPTNRTNQRNMKSFTRQLAQFIQDRDSFYDMYPNTTITKDQKPPQFYAQPLPTSTSFSATITTATTEHSRQYSFRSVQAKYKHFFFLYEM
jgi:hypothetical protein